MIGLHHSIVIFFGILGLILGGILIDLDHTGSWQCKWNGFWGANHNCPDMQAGILHNPLILLSTITFSFGIGFGALIHLLMDFIKYVR